MRYVFRYYLWFYCPLELKFIVLFLRKEYIILHVYQNMYLVTLNNLPPFYSLPLFISQNIHNDLINHNPTLSISLCFPIHFLQYMPLAYIPCSNETSFLSTFFYFWHQSVVDTCRSYNVHVVFRRFLAPNMVSWKPEASSDSTVAALLQTLHDDLIWRATCSLRHQCIIWPGRRKSKYRQHVCF